MFARVIALAFVFGRIKKGAFYMWEQVLSWDSSALLALQGMHNPVLDFLMPIITTLGNGGMLWIALTAVLLIFRKT